MSDLKNTKNKPILGETSIFNISSIKGFIINLIDNYKKGIYRVLGTGVIIAIYILLDLECPFLKYLNIPCLGCGMTRAWKAAITGNFSLAFEYHRAYWTVPVLFLYIFKGNLLFKKHIWDMLIVVFIVIVFIVNYI